MICGDSQQTSDEPDLADQVYSLMLAEAHGNHQLEKLMGTKLVTTLKSTDGSCPYRYHYCVCSVINYMVLL